MKENKVQQFLNDNFGEVRCFADELNNPWFCANDIAKCLEDRDGNKVTRILDEEDLTTHIVGTKKGNRELTFISEGGLYQVILTKKPKDNIKKTKIKEFKKWITNIVIPAIRKDGAYINNEEKLQNKEMSEDEFILQAMKMLQNKVQRYKEENEVLKGLTDSFLNGKDCYDVGTYSKIISAKDPNTNKILGRNKLFQWLKDNKILMSNNMPYQNMMDYFKVISVENKFNGHINNKTLITPKGIKYIYKRLLKDNKVIDKDFETIISELKQQPA